MTGEKSESEELVEQNVRRPGSRLEIMSEFAHKHTYSQTDIKRTKFKEIELT